MCPFTIGNVRGLHLFDARSIQQKPTVQKPQRSMADTISAHEQAMQIIPTTILAGSIPLIGNFHHVCSLVLFLTISV